MTQDTIEQPNNEQSPEQKLIRVIEMAVEQLNLALRDVHDNDILAEFISPLRLRNPRAVGQLLMTLLGDEILHDEEKLFWAEAAIHMGPNWIAKLRTTAAFMALVDGFAPR